METLIKCKAYGFQIENIFNYETKNITIKNYIIVGDKGYDRDKEYMFEILLRHSNDLKDKLPDFKKLLEVYKKDYLSCVKILHKDGKSFIRCMEKDCKETILLENLSKNNYGHYCSSDCEFINLPF